nr:DUF4340 domain-containing protein [uncultured Desulfobulbus sp.]
MKRWITLCALLALAQAGLTLWTNWNAGGQQRAVAKGNLVALNVADIDTLLFEESDGNTLKIQKIDGRWQLPDSMGFPADSIRVQGLVEKITQLKREWPEASTAEAATRFKVSRDNFAHRLRLSGQGKELQVIYFGSSPGLRQLYLRCAGDPEIHSIEMTAHDLSTRPGDWIDTTVLHLKKEQLVEVKLPEIDLTRVKGSLQPVDLQQGEEVEAHRLNGLLNRLTGLSISAILGSEDKPEYGLAKPVFSYSVSLENGQIISYSFAQKTAAQTPDDQASPQESSYILKTSALNQLVQVDGWQVDALKKIKRTDIVQHKAVAEEEKDASSQVPHSSPQ